MVPISVTEISKEANIPYCLLTHRSTQSSDCRLLSVPASTAPIELRVFFIGMDNNYYKTISCQDGRHDVGFVNVFALLQW